MATTTPDNIRTPDAGDQYALVQDLGALADSTQNALVRRANTYTGTSAQRIAFTSAAQGVIWVDTNSGRRVFTRQGSEWVHLSSTRSGRVTGISAPANTAVDVDVPFPSGSFTTTPDIVLSPNNPVAWDPVRFRVYTRSSTGFTVQLLSPTARTSVAFDWIATV